MGKKRRFKPWNNSNNQNQNRKQFLTSKCTECGIEFTPPFNPESTKNVFCKSCFVKLSQEVLA